MKKNRPSWRLFVMLITLGIIGATTALTREQPGKLLEFKLIENWPSLEAGTKLGGVSAVASDSKDNIYLLLRTKPHVMVLDKAGKLVRSWNGEFTTPHGMRIDKNDNVWIADMDNHLVQKFAPEGKLLMSLGMKDKPGWTENQFNQPADAFVGPDGELYVADGYGNSRIAKFNQDGKFVKEWGKKGKGPSQFRIPHVVFLDEGNRVLVGDRENKRVQIFDRAGKFLEQWKDTGAPYGLAIHKERIYLADGIKGTIRVLDKEGKPLARWETAMGKDTPHWIHVDRQGAVYVGFVSGSKVQKWVAK